MEVVTSYPPSGAASSFAPLFPYRNFMKSKLIRKLHRWLGLIFSLSVLTASGSGVIHNVMTRTQPPPPQVGPSGQGIVPSDVTVAVPDAITALEATDSVIQSVNLISISDSPWYQIHLQGASTPSYVSATSGKLDSSQDEVYASEIASRFLGGVEVTKTDFLASFNSEYIGIFRILPVYRFDAGDERESRVYVSTLTGSVTRHTDDQKQLQANIFTNFHKFGFIPNKDLRDFVLTTVTIGTFIVACLGVVLFFATRPRKKASK